MAVDATRTLRGAVAGALAAGVWAVQQPLDKRVFGIDYDDADLLGRLVAQGRWILPAGTALHLSNGALFGAVYANVAPRVPLAPWVRGPLAGLLEHVLTWPATGLLGRLKPGSGELPPLWGSHRAFAQATWRHLLFGAVLGELERRLNADHDREDSGPAAYSSNGHGSSEQLAATGPSVR